MEEESHQDSPNIQLDRGELTPGDWLAFIDCFRAIVYRVDKNHLITVANSALCTYLGKSLDNIIGRDCQDVFGEAIGELHQELNEKVFQTREAIEREEIIVDRQGIEGFFLVRRK